MAGEIREKCAVSGGVATSPELAVAPMMYESLFAMQHRGTEASGIASQADSGEFYSHSGPGMVRDVYNEARIRSLAGNLAVGMNQYSTYADEKGAACATVTDESIGFAFGQNGNQPDTSVLETHLSRHNIQTARMIDTQMMGESIGQYIRSGRDLPTAVELAYPLFHGAFSSVAMHDGVLVAFRDPKGIRPLAIGDFDEGYMVASETCGLDIVDAQYRREVEPGEMVIITKDGVESRMLAEGESKLDIFEFVYFARHDSYLYDQSVNEYRYRCGEQLAEQHPITTDPKNTLVIPIPDTSIPAAEGYAEAQGLRHRQAIIKNRYIGRTFMQPTHAMRSGQLRRKHNAVREAMSGHDIVYIDDSIVRLNTAPLLVELAKQSGARSVTFLVASPPVRFPDFYGIDTPSQDELAAANMTTEQMRRKIGSTYLGYLSLDRLIAATNLPADRFNLSSITGEYPIDIGRRKKEIRAPVSMEYAE